MNVLRLELATAQRKYAVEGIIDPAPTRTGKQAIVPYRLVANFEDGMCVMVTISGVTVPGGNVFHDSYSRNRLDQLPEWAKEATTLKENA